MGGLFEREDRSRFPPYMGNKGEDLFNFPSLLLIK